MKRSQISIFILMSILVVILVLVMVNLNNRFRGDVIAEGVGASIPDQDPFNAYLKECVRNVLDPTLDQLFRQGGILYSSDGGPFEISQVTYTQSDSIRLFHGISNRTPSDFTVPLNFKPQYVQTRTVSGLFTQTAEGNPDGLFNIDEYYFIPFFGTNKIPKLCNRVGPNGVTLGGTKSSCIHQLYNVPGDEMYTIQSQLNQALSSKVVSCLESQTLHDRYVFQSTGDGSVSVMFGDDDIYLDINLSINYILQNREYVLDGLNYSFPYRVKRLYTLAYLMAKHDTRDIFFDIYEDYKIIPGCLYRASDRCWDETIEVLIENVGISERYQIVTLRDRSSQLQTLWDSRSTNFLQYQFIIENRRPYLEYIPNIFSSDSRVNFSLFVEDPDGDADLIFSSNNYEIARTKVNGVDKPPEFSRPLANGTYVWAPVSNFERNIAGEQILNKLRTISRGEVLHLHCEEFCVERSGNDLLDLFYDTRYYLTARIWDGQYYDYQDFIITISS